MKKIILTIAVASALLACCTSKTTQAVEDKIENAADVIENAADSLINRPLLGGDRDEHGCIPSAGYIWCEELQECIRPWETPCDSE